MQLFVSHSSQNDSFVDRIYEALSEVGISSWVDHINGVGAGDDWDAAIQNALNECKSGLLVLSRASIESEECRNEWRTILNLGKRLYVVLIEEISPQDFPYRLRTIQYVNLVSNFENGMEEIIRAIQQDRDQNQLLPDQDTSQVENTLLSDDAQNLFSLQKLRLAWVKTWEYAKSNAIFYDSFAYQKYNHHLEARLVLLKERLLTDKYEFEPLNCIAVPKGDSTRLLYYAPPETALVLQIICDAIGPVLENSISDSSYANRLSDGNQLTKSIFQPWQESYGQFKKSVQTYAEQNPDTWYHRSDISNFYPSIKTTLLLPIVSRRIEDPRILRLLRMFFDLHALYEDGELRQVPGIPAGVPLAHVLANIFLAELDKVMEENALAYYRYVDDVVFFGPDEQAVFALQDLFESQLQSEKFGGLAPNKLKGETHRSADRLVLYSLLQDISQIVWLSSVEEIPEQQKRELAKSLYDVLVAAEGVDDPTSLARYAALAIWRLDRLGFREDLSSIAYKFLEIGPLRPNVVRSLLLYLIQQHIENPPSDFIDFVVSAYDYIKISFLQILRDLNVQIHANVWDIVISCLDSANLYVCGEAAVTLLGEDVPPAIMEQVSVNKLVEATQPDYLRVRGLFLSVRIDVPVNEHLLLFLNSGISDLINVALDIVESNAAQVEMSQIVIQTPLPEDPRITVLYTYSILKVLILQNRESLTDSLITILNEHLAPLSGRARDDLVSIASEDVFENDPRKLSISDELRRDAEATTIIDSTQRAQSGLFEEIGGELVLFRKYRQITSKERMHKLADYRCHLFEDIKTGSKVLVEFIRDDLLLSRGFEKFEDWEKYLQALDAKNIIMLRDVRKLDRGNSVVVYGLPEGFLTIDEWFEQTGRPFRELNEAFQILLALNDAVHQAQRRDFHVVNVHGELVMCSGDRRVKLLGIGASLVLTPRYLSSHSLRIAQDEVGFAAYSKFLGFLAFEMFTDSCAIETVEDAERRGKITFLSYSDKLDKYPSHLRAFLTRTNYKYPDFRYTDYKSIKEDINHIIDFLGFYLQSQHVLTKSQKRTVELVDFLRLRLRTHLRNPHIKEKHFFEQAYNLLLKISDDFDLFARPSNDSLAWLKSVTHAAKSRNVFGRAMWAWLSPTSRHLSRVTLTWQQVLKEYGQIDLPATLENVKDTQIISSTILLEIIRIEALAYAQSLGYFSKIVCSEDLKVTAEFDPAQLQKQKDLLIALSVPPEKHLTVSFSGNSADVDFAWAAIQYLAECDLTEEVFTASKYLKSLDSIAFFVAAIGGGLTIWDSSRNMILSTCSANDNPKKLEKSAKNLDAALEIRDFENKSERLLSNPGSMTPDILWSTFTQTLTSIKQATPANRIRAKVMNYKYAVYDRDRYGELSYFDKTHFWKPSQRKFLESHLVDRRELNRSIESTYPARVDFVTLSDPVLCTVLIRSHIWFHSLGIERPQYQLRLLSWWKRARIFLILAIVVVSIVFFMEIIPESWGIWQTIVTAVGTVTSGYLTNKLSEIPETTLFNSLPERDNP